MSWFTENPWPLIGLAVLVEIVLIGVWRNTRNKAVFYVMGGVALVLAACVILEWYIVTDVEEIENTLDEAAAAIEEGDVDKVLSFLAPPPEADSLRRLVQSYLPAYPVRECTFDDPRVTFIEGEGRRYAEVKVWIKVYLKDPERVDAPDPIPDELTFKARKSGERWELVDFDSRFFGEMQ